MQPQLSPPEQMIRLERPPTAHHTLNGLRRFSLRMGGLGCRCQKAYGHTSQAPLAS